MSASWYCAGEVGYEVRIEELVGKYASGFGERGDRVGVIDNDHDAAVTVELRGQPRSATSAGDLVGAHHHQDIGIYQIQLVEVGDRPRHTLIAGLALQRISVTRPPVAQPE